MNFVSSHILKVEGHRETVRTGEVRAQDTINIYSERSALFSEQSVYDTGSATACQLFFVFLYFGSSVQYLHF